MIFGAFFAIVMAFAVASVVAFVFWIISIIEVARAPEAAFGPPWDNGKTPWILGLVVGMLLPAGTIVTTILWWMQGHKALRAGRPVPKPFWAPSKQPYPPPYGYPPPGYGYPPGYGSQPLTPDQQPDPTGGMPG